MKFIVHTPPPPYLPKKSLYLETGQVLVGPALLLLNTLLGPVQQGVHGRVVVHNIVGGLALLVQFLLLLVIIKLCLNELGNWYILF